MKKQLIAAATTVLAVGLIAGCGGSGSNSSMNQADSTMINQSSTMMTQSSVGKNVIAGAVADGYLVNATVFLDRNRDYQLNQGEVSTTTKADGSYQLIIDTTDLDSNGKLKYPVVALAIAGTTYDLDDPTHTPLKSSYVMSMHAVSVTPSVSGEVTGSVNNFISPISTQIREMMETGKYDNIQSAMADLRIKLGMPTETNLLQDYMAAKHVGMHTAAQNIANVMGLKTAQVIESGGTTPTVHVERYRGMVGAIFSNMSSIRGANAPTKMPELANMMTPALDRIPIPKGGMPYRNMSSAFRGGMGMMGR